MGSGQGKSRRARTSPKWESELHDFGAGAKVLAAKHGIGGGWVAATAQVDSTVYVGEDAVVFGRAELMGNARVEDHACVFGTAFVCENARITDYASVSGHAYVAGHAVISFKARVFGKANVDGYAKVGGTAIVKDDADVGGSMQLSRGTYVDKVVSESSSVPVPTPRLEPVTF